MSGALIVTAGLGSADFSQFDQLRRTHFPPERNQLSAHLTMFHALPPSAEVEIVALLKALAVAHPPAATTDGLINLGKGVAIRIWSAELAAHRAHIASHFHGSLTSQDAAGWRPHITIQNKMESKEAKALFDGLAKQWHDRPVQIAALELHRYMGGPWAPIGRYSFRG